MNPAQSKFDILDDNEPIVILDDSTDISTIAPTLLDYDRCAEHATFSIGHVTYVVEVPHDDATTKLSVTIRHNGLVYADVFNLAVEAACKRFAGNAALRCGISADIIAEHLPLLLVAVQQLRADADGLADEETTIEPTGVDREQSLILLRQNDLLDQIGADLTTLGWIGEDDAKRLLVLTALSRKLPTPLWALRVSNASVSDSSVLCLADMTPPEDVVHVSRLTNAALSYQDTNALRHKLLLIDDASTLTKEVVTSLQILQKRGALSQSIVPRHNLSGSSRTQTNEIRGPLAVIAATTAASHKQLGTSCCIISTDTSEVHMQKVYAAERAMYAKPTNKNDSTRLSLISKLHNVQRLLHRYPVIIPFAERIHFPNELLHQHGVQTRFLGVIAASALLHQYQRLRDDGYIIATERDFQTALSLSHLICAREPIGLGVPATTLLNAVKQAGLTSFTQETIRELLPQWGRMSFRSAVAELLKEEFITCDSKGRGVQHVYYVVADDEQDTIPAIRLEHITKPTEVSWLVG